MELVIIVLSIMMENVIEVRIREVAIEKGITTAYQLQKLCDVQPSLAAKWYKNDITMFAVATIDLLCRKLECTPNDLLVFKK